MLKAPEGQVATAVKISSVLAFPIFIQGCSFGLKTLERFLMQLAE